MIVQNAEKTIAITLESLARTYDELIIVDGGSTDKTCEIATNYGAKIIRSPWPDDYSQQRNIYLKEVKTDWVFVLDADEFIDRNTSEFLQRLRKGLVTGIDTDNFYIPRKWISPIAKKYYISSLPHFSDKQRRLFKFNENLNYTGIIDEVLEGCQLPPIVLNLSIYHLHLYVNSQSQHWQKANQYLKNNPQNVALQYYLPSLDKMQLTAWNTQDLLPQVNKLIDNIGKVSNPLTNVVLSSQISESDRIILPDIKNDDFYQAIQTIAKQNDVKTVLEIGSSSGEGSTEAWVKGLRDNPNQPTLFCMEVSKNRCELLKNYYLQDSFVKCYNISSVSISDFPTEAEVIKFWQSYQTNLRDYPLELVLSWLKQDIEYIKLATVSTDGITKIKQENGIENFDAVLIDGSEFTGAVELEQVYGSKYILLDDINTFKNYKSHRRLLADPNYTMIAQNLKLRNGYSIFQKNEQIITENLDLPIHFFTIVLNGEPFIRYHINIFRELPFKWHWHIVEGIAEIKSDQTESSSLKDRITDDMHQQGLSNDGTSTYLDELLTEYPGQITIYRKPSGKFWDNKLEMINAPLANISEECLLWQIDVDEMWNLEQICRGRQLFLQNPTKTAAFYGCWYFVATNLVISTRNFNGPEAQQQFLRTWRFKPGYLWTDHTQPMLVEILANGEVNNIGSVNPLTYAETEKKDLVFQNFAYVTEKQLAFKEKYYGYKNAVEQWFTLLSEQEFPTSLNQYFPWFDEDIKVDKIEKLGIIPIIYQDQENDLQFRQSFSYLPFRLESDIKKNVVILIDGVFFQMYRTGIARVWKSLLARWVENGFAENIVVLDRMNTVPKITGVRYKTIPAYDYGNTEVDRAMLQKICDEEEADIFISSYYTTPISTPSVFMAYDMIPEVMGADMDDLMWIEKHYGISHASSYISISENTKADLMKFFPKISPNQVTVAHCGIDPIFQPATSLEVNQFKHKYGISKPYFILTGATSGYKNAQLFFSAFYNLCSKDGFEIVYTGNSILDEVLRRYTIGIKVHTLYLSDEELRSAYAGAVALVYPSKYEGFGMPIIEAMACGCPVITCPNSSLPEAGGEAVIYVNDSNVDNLIDAMCDVQKTSVRNTLITAGLAQANKFSWEKMADIVSQALIEATLLRLNLKDINLIVLPNWSASEEVIFAELSEVIKTVASHPDQNNITLLIDNSNITGEEADLMLSSILMNLMMEEEIDVTETLEIVLIGELSDMQWQSLIPKLQARIILESENSERIVQLKLSDLVAIKTDDILSYSFNL
jgi:glycosyltransferase involved in cell wall biosynthesis